MDAIRKRLVHGGLWAITGRSSAIFLGLGLNVLLARTLSPRDLGAYFVAVTLVGFLSIVGMLGLNRSVVRFVGESIGRGQHQRSRKILKIVFLFGGLSSLAIAVAYSLLGDWLSGSVLGSHALAAATTLVAIWLGLSILQQLHVEALRAFHDLRSVTILDPAAGLLTKGLVLIAVILLSGRGNAHLNTVLLAYISALAVGLLFSAYALRKKISQLGSGSSIVFDHRDQLLFGKVLRASLPLLGTGVMFSLLSASGIWILAAFRSEQEVALYSASFRLGSLVTFFALAAAQVLPPMIAELYARGEKKRLQKLLQKLAALTVIPTIVVASVFVLFGTQILGLVYGNFYRDGASVLAILCLGWVIAVWTGQCQETLMMAGYERILLIQIVISTAIGLLLALILVRPFGAEGVGVSWVVAISLQNLGAVLLARYKTGLWVHAGSIVSEIRGAKFGLSTRLWERT
jgi:O-antigen/teichoic acid export membrane protein